MIVEDHKTAETTGWWCPGSGVFVVESEGIRYSPLTERGFVWLNRSHNDGTLMNWKKPGWNLVWMIFAILLLAYFVLATALRLGDVFSWVFSHVSFH